MMPALTENDTLLKILNKYGINSPQKLTSQRSGQIFNEYKRLYQADLIPKESITQTHREALEKYMSEQVVFIQSGANFLNMIKDNAPEVYNVTEVSNQLTGDTGKYDVSIMNLIIPERSKNKEAALKFALYLTNSENQLQFAKLTTILPVNNNTLKNAYFKTNSGDVISRARYLSARQLDNLALPVRSSKNRKEILMLLNTSVQEILLNKSDTASALKKTAEMWKGFEK
jgi:putative chitobiose transport system substrate-binding protein